MKISYNWLQQVLNFQLSPEELAEALTGAGFPVEDMSPLAEGIEGVVVAELLEVNPHPNADRLSLTKVSDGAKVYDVVCGAHNIAVGDKVPFAKIGAVLPGNFKIKRAKIRGEISEGMLCSAEELKLDLVQDRDGILQLPKDSQPGLSLVESLGLDDVILDIELTANRGDLQSVRGLTAEIAAILGKPFLLAAPESPGTEVFNISAAIETKACPRYTGRLIRGVTVKPSPLWLQLRLLACGLRPVNNIVDITNLTMLEWGQPLHAFDADKLPELNICVRQARDGEKIVTLDGKERELEAQMMLITSGDKPVAIAGVMGSLDSEVDAGTKNILLESADFDPVSIRITGKSLGLASEAASRYEKGIDPAVIVPASHRAAALMAEIAGGTVGKLVSAGIERPASWTVEASLESINVLLGTEIPREKAIAILANLGLKVKAAGEPLALEIPGRRPDLQIWQDIAEEVGRLNGLDKVPSTLPQGALTPGGRTSQQRLQWQIRGLLAGCGLHEVVSYAFISPEAAAKSAAAPGVEISNPLTKERSLMRGSMLPSLLETVQYNLSHGQQGVAIFEIGSIYRPDPGNVLPYQTLRVAGALVGALPGHWQKATGNYDFYALKGVVEQLLLGIGVKARFEKDENRQFHPGRCGAVYAGSDLLGHFGQVHPLINGRWKLETEVWYFDLDFAALCEARTDEIIFRAPSRYPAIHRDLALETDIAVAADSLEAVIREIGGQLLESVVCFDVYSGPNLGPGRKSLAFALSFRHSERTLLDEEVEKLLEAMIDRLEQRGARLRS